VRITVFCISAYYLFDSSATLGINEMCSLVDSVVSAINGVEKVEEVAPFDVSSPSSKFMWIKCDDDYLSSVVNIQLINHLRAFDIY